MELTLYVECDKYDPISHLCKIWCKVYGIQLEVIETHHSQSSLGKFPILRLNQFVFASGNIVQVLEHIANIDSDLALQAKNYCKVLEEYCVHKLHPSSVFAMSQFKHVKNNFSISQATFKSLKELLRFPYTHYKVAEKISKLYGVKSPSNAYQLADNSHKILSGLLADYKFFSSEYSNSQRPHSIDFIVFVYLFEEIYNLPGHPHVEDSLRNYENLIGFMHTMENEIAEKSYPLDLQVNLEENWIKSMVVKDSEKFEIGDEEKKANERRGFVTVAAGVVLGFLWLSDKK